MQLSYLLPLGWLLYMLKPLKVWRYAFIEKRPHSSLIISGMNWMFICAGIAIYEAVFLNTGLQVSRTILALGVCMQAFWGVAQWLHEDHQHLSIKKRPHHWILSYSLWFALMALSLRGLGLGDWMPDIAANLVVIEVSLFLIAYFGWTLWWFRSAFFSLDDWHRIPMNFSTDRDH